VNLTPLENADCVIDRLGRLLSLLDSFAYANAVAALHPDQHVDRSELVREHREALASASEWMRVAGEQRAEWAKLHGKGDDQ